MAGGFTKLAFSFSSKTEIYESCSLIFKGIMFVFGGKNYKRQISRVTGCELERVGNLDFNFRKGACTMTLGKILLCFPYSDLKQEFVEARVCRIAHSPTSLFSTIPESYYGHFETQIASNGGN